MASDERRDEEGAYRGGQPRTVRVRRRTGAFALAGVGLLALALAGCSTSGGSSGTNTSGNGHTVTLTGTASDLQTAVENVIKSVEPSVVEVTSSNCNNGGQQIGSGEILTSDGYIVTNNHVVAGCTSFQVQFADGKQVNASQKGTDPADDLAVLKVSQTGLHPITIGDSSKVAVGEFVVAVGSPLGLSQSATFGIISATNRTGTENVNNQLNTLVGLIQTSAPINPGNSGGALVDLSGNLVGIPTLAAVNPEDNSAANGIGFAIPSNRVQYVAKQIIAGGQVNTNEGFLGIQGTDVTPQLAQEYGLSAQSGVIVTNFANDTQGNSPAQQAGIQQGDIIIAVNGHQVPDSATLVSILDSDQPGTQVTATVMRGSSKQDIKVTLGQRPSGS